jgi:hypothetical protein
MNKQTTLKKPFVRSSIRAFVLFVLSAFCFLLSAPAQNPLPREYEYDLAGNRTLRKVVPPKMITEPTDSTDTSHSSPLTSDFYTETIAQTEIKIYPNPTTEKITLEITNMETLQTGIFQLYSMSGQLLQKQPVYSSTTEISLAGLARGSYILKVKINDTIEDWKIIKQ